MVRVVVLSKLDQITVHMPWSTQIGIKNHMPEAFTCSSIVAPWVSTLRRALDPPSALSKHVSVWAVGVGEGSDLSSNGHTSLQGVSRISQAQHHILADLIQI